MFDAQYSPLEFDVLLTDVNARDLRYDISAGLGIPYLSECADDSVAKDIRGIIWGPHNRLFASLKIAVGASRMRNVHMIIDTCSPQTYLCSDAFSAFGRLVQNPSNPTSVNINGTALSVLESPARSHFSEVNILGTDYMRTTNAKMEVDFCNDSLHIFMP